MIIGNKNMKQGERPQLNKWYWCIEISKCPPTMINIFKPYLFIMLVKYKSIHNLCSRIDTSIEDKIGGYKQWSFPIGIRIEIIK